MHKYYMWYVYLTTLDNIHHVYVAVSVACPMLN